LLLNTTFGATREGNLQRWKEKNPLCENNKNINEIIEIGKW
jgi:hypothetical protein